MNFFCFYELKKGKLHVNYFGWYKTTFQKLLQYKLST